MTRCVCCVYYNRSVDGGHAPLPQQKKERNCQHCIDPALEAQNTMYVILLTLLLNISTENQPVFLQPDQSSVPNTSGTCIIEPDGAVVGADDGAGPPRTSHPHASHPLHKLAKSALFPFPTPISPVPKPSLPLPNCLRCPSPPHPSALYRVAVAATRRRAIPRVHDPPTCLPLPAEALRRVSRHFKPPGGCVATVCSPLLLVRRR